MGIKNLFPFLKQYCKDAKLTDFAGKTAAIDASCWIHRALAISVSESGNRERLGSIFRKHLTLVKKAGVISFVVFDGSPLPAKANEAAKRQKMKDNALRRANEAANLEEHNKFLSQGISISFEDISTCIEICVKENIRYIVSAYESDAQIASLVKHGHADFAITEDSDLLAYGCKEVPVNSDEYQFSEETHNETNENERLEVAITQIDSLPFSYRIPSFPVITVNLKKVKYIRGGKEYDYMKD